MADNTLRLGGLATGMDTDAIIKQMLSSKKTRVNNFTKSQTKTTWKQEAYQSLNKDLATFIVDAKKKLGIDANYTYSGRLKPNSIDKVSWAKKAETTGDSFEAAASAGAPDGSIKVSVKQLATSATVTGSVTSKSESDRIGKDIKLRLKINKEDKVIELKSGETIQDAVKKLKDAGLNASFGKVGTDSKGKSTSMLFLSSKVTGANQSIQSDDVATQNFFKSLGIDSKSLKKGIKGQNSIITVNGQEVENNVNDVSVNGINLSLKKVDTTEHSVTVKANTDEIFNKIKEFVEGYNKIIKTMQEKTSEKTFRKYEPLLKEERDALSEEERKMWDEKAKSGLLANDTTIANMLGKVRSGLYQKVEGADGMYNIGITTGNYKDGAILKIDEKKLKEAIGKDPQNVLDTLFKASSDIKTHKPNSFEAQKQREQTGVFVRILDDMSDGINEIAKQSGVGNESSIVQQVRGNILTGIVKNNSVVERSLLEINKRIDLENERLSAYEESLWKRFSAMETAIQKMQSQTSWMQQQQQ